MTGTSWEHFETLESYIAKTERMHPHSRGVFSQLLRRIGVATKVISSKVQRAGFLQILGANGSTNTQGETQMKLDVLANKIMSSTLRWMPSIAGLASEENEDLVALPPRPQIKTGIEDELERYVINFDPLDGSSNIDADVSVGTIFSIHRSRSGSKECQLSDFLQPGYKQVAAGYVIYGSATMFVYTTGQGVHGFTLEPEIGEYILSHENIHIPEKCKCFSANDCNYDKWDEPTQRFVDLLRYGKKPRYKGITSRYIGSLVGDFHRNLLYGGIFLYPYDVTKGGGKLRLMYECAPMAMIAQQAGGLASTGRERILDIQPTDLHQRVPFVVGNRREVELYERMIRQYYEQREQEPIEISTGSPGSTPPESRPPRIGKKTSKQAQKATEQQLKYPFKTFN